MTMTVAEALWNMLVSAGVRRCYGIVGDSLNPLIDALRRDGRVEFVHDRHEEAGVFAAVAEASLTGQPVAVCGTAGPGSMHLPSGLMDARREYAPIIAISGDTTTALMDTWTAEDLNTYDAFSAVSLYTGRIVNPAQTRAVVQRAVQTAVTEPGPVVIAVAPDIAVSPVPKGKYVAALNSPPVLRPAEADLRDLAARLNAAKSVTIFGGDGCRDAHDEVVALSERLRAPVAFTYRGKQWLEWDNPNAVGMTGLLGWGGAYEAMHHCDLCLLLGTDFPFTDFLPDKPVKVQIDRHPANLARRTPVDLALVGDIKDTVTALLPLVGEKTDGAHLHRALTATAKWRKRMGRYVDRGPEIRPIRPEYLVSAIDEHASADAVFTCDVGTANIWTARYLSAGRHRRLLTSYSWGSMAIGMPKAIGAALAAPGRQVIALCGDGGLSMLMGDLLTIAARRLPVKLLVLNNSRLDFVHIEMEEAGLQPHGTDFDDVDYARIADAMGIPGQRAEDPATLSANVAWLLETPGPALLDVVVEQHALSLPPHVGIGLAEGFALSMAKQAINGNLDEVIDTVKNNVRLL
ncbi:thiamine pyrophosphate-dependent enzyme [Nocardia crassostreae]|uniref:thiamine pyrophosphate-dependent enzyme n=1 Tax=Nocardia crassostreae TaxID=53428 RepID=UPI0008339A5C|nr:thiamine pyrophosphate-dependent enzyme [Nocardia crassostreae]